MIHRISVPTPFAVGPVNAYLLEDDPLTLVDSGPDSATSLVALERGLAEHGHRVEDLERLVVTHQHIDHVGLLHVLAERSGAEVVALDELGPWLADYDAQMEADDVFAEEVMHANGVPDDVVLALRTVSRLTRAWGTAATVTRTVREGDVLEFAGTTWTVHHRPGHSPSDTVFHDAASRTLVGGDHLLGHVSSNPLLSRPLRGPSWPRPQALVVFLESMRATAAMDLDVVLPGHGEPVADHRALIEERMRLHERRAAKIARMVGEEPQTAYDIATKMWGSVAITQGYLTISEVLGHVDMLLERGEVAAHEADGVVTFASA